MMNHTLLRRDSIPHLARRDTAIIPMNLDLSCRDSGCNLVLRETETLELPRRNTAEQQHQDDTTKSGSHRQDQSFLNLRRKTQHIMGQMQSQTMAKMTST